MSTSLSKNRKSTRLSVAGGGAVNQKVAESENEQDTDADSISALSTFLNTPGTSSSSSSVTAQVLTEAQATTTSQKRNRRTVTKKSITTEKVQRSYRTSTPSAYEYVEDTWELLPKTDYTYAHSATYTSSLLETPKPPSPNMSRRRIRGDEVTPIDSYSDMSTPAGKTPSPAGTRSGLKYGIRPTIDRHDQGEMEFQSSRLYTDYLRPSTSTATRASSSLSEKLNYSQENQSLSYLWGTDYDATDGSSIQSDHPQHFNLFSWIITIITSVITAPFAWLYSAESSEVMTSKQVTSLVSESEDEEENGEETQAEEDGQNMGIILGLLNQLICVMSFLFITLPLACGLSAIWLVKGPEKSDEEVTEEEFTSDTEDIEINELNDDGAMNTEQSQELTSDDEEPSFCEDIPDLMMWLMNSVLVTLPSAVFNTLLSPFRSTDSVDVDDGASDDGYDEVDIRIESSETVISALSHYIRTLLHFLLIAPFVLIGKAAITSSKHVVSLVQDYVLFLPYFLFYSLPKYAVTSVMNLFSSHVSTSTISTSEQILSDSDDEDDDNVITEAAQDKSMLSWILDSILAFFYFIVVMLPSSVGNYAIDLVSSPFRRNIYRDAQISEDSDNEITFKKSVFGTMIINFLMLPYHLIFTLPTAVGEIAIKCASGESDSEGYVIEEGVEYISDVSDNEDDGNVEDFDFVEPDIFADRNICVRSLLYLVNGLIVVLGFLLVTLPTGFGLYVWSFFAKTDGYYEETESADVIVEGDIEIGEGEESFMSKVSRFIVNLLYNVFVLLPGQTLSTLWWAVTTPTCALFNAIVKGFSRLWDIWWDVVIWIVTLPHRAWKSVFGTSNNDFETYTDEVKIKQGKRRTRSSMAAKTAGAALLTDVQGAEAASLLNDSDSGIDSADEVDYESSSSSSIVESMSDWILWPFWLVTWKFPLSVGNIALRGLNGASSAVYSFGCRVLRCLEQLGIYMHHSIASVVSADIGLLAISSKLRRDWGLCCVIPLIFLIPLLLFGALYLMSCGTGGLMAALPVLLPSNDETTLIPPPSCSQSCPQPSGNSINAASVLTMSDAELEDRIRTIMAGYSSADDKQQVIFNSFKSEVDNRIENIILKLDDLQTSLKAENDDKQQKLNANIASVKAELLGAMQTQGDDGKQISIDALDALNSRIDGLQASITQLESKQADHSAKIAALQTGFDDVLARAVAVATDLDKAKSLLAEGQSAAAKENGLIVAALEERMKSLAGDIASLNAAHLLFENKTRECCRNESALMLLVKDAVHAEAVRLQSQKADAPVNVAVAGISEDRVSKLIHDALLVYGADKTGRVDYALESAGGSVINTRCTETFNRRTTEISLFGIPLWYATNSPRTVIQPDMQPGQCWAFKGTQGFLVIQLLTPIEPTAFSLEHIPKSLSPNGRIESAPYKFSVLGLEDEHDTEGFNLGNFSYEDNGEALQFFPVQNARESPFRYVELRITSNHGNNEYTCLYRFRVHGVPHHSS